MPRVSIASCLLCALVVATASPARAQGDPGEDASASASASAVASAPPSPMIAPPPPSSSATNDRPARGASVRERGGRRARGGSAATGALFLVILVGAMGYYVMKKLRR